jgi:amicyanin
MIRTIALLAVLVAAWPSAAARAAEVSIKIANFTFSPQRLTVKAGTTVTWTNDDDIPHTVNASNQAFKSGALDTDQKFSFTFATPGTYQYFCALHPHMTGTIVVEAATGSNTPR